MTSRFWILVTAAVAFAAYSVYLVAGHGVLGFIDVARREPWAQQMLIDLVIALFLFLSWARRDARANGLPYWPFLVATLLLGSIGALSYLAVREARRSP